MTRLLRTAHMALALLPMALAGFALSFGPWFAIALIWSNSR